MRIFSWIGIARIAVADHLAVHDGRAAYDMAEPLGPRPVVGDASEGGNHVPIAGRLGLVEHGLVEARASASRLIDDVGLDSVAFAVGMVAIEDKLGVALSEEDLLSCDTVGDLEAAILAKVPAAQSNS